MWRNRTRSIEVKNCIYAYSKIVDFPQMQSHTCTCTCTVVVCLCVRVHVHVRRSSFFLFSFSISFSSALWHSVCSCVKIPNLYIHTPLVYRACEHPRDEWRVTISATYRIRMWLKLSTMYILYVYQAYSQDWLFYQLKTCPFAFNWPPPRSCAV